MTTKKSPESETRSIGLTNGFQFGLLGGLGVLTALALGNALVTLANVVTYVALAIFIALGLDPVVRFLERRFSLKRSLSIFGVVIFLVAFLGIILWSLLPAVTAQTAHFIESAPELLTSVKSVEIVATLDSQFGGAISVGRIVPRRGVGGHAHQFLQKANLLVKMLVNPGVELGVGGHVSGPCIRGVSQSSGQANAGKRRRRVACHRKWCSPAGCG